MFAYAGELYKQSSGDAVGMSAEVTHRGNCFSTGDECAEIYRGQVNDMDGSETDFFYGTVATTSNVSGITTITYADTGSDNLRGEDRLLVKTSGTPYTTGTISGITGTPPTVTGSGTAWATTFGSGNHSDLCFWVTGDSAGGYNDVFPVSSITNNTTLVLSTLAQGVQHSYPAQLAGTGAYALANCAEFTGTLTTADTVSTTNGYIWQVGDTFEQSPGYAKRVLGLNLQANSYIPFLSSFPSYGIDLSMNGRWFQAGFALSGTAPLLRGIDFQNPWPSGVNSYAFNFANNPTYVNQFNTAPAANLLLYSIADKAGTSNLAYTSSTADATNGPYWTWNGPKGVFSSDIN